MIQNITVFVRQFMSEEGFSEWSCKKRGSLPYSLKAEDRRRWYQRDIDQIIYSIAFRKLQHKSQLLSEKDPRSRSRLIHTLEVSRMALEISERLGLDKELTEAISMGHDLGTSPYGHIGNEVLCKKCPGYSHEEAGREMLLDLARITVIDDQHRDKITAELKHNNGLGLYGFKIAGLPFRLHGSVLEKRTDRKEPHSRTYFEYIITEEVLDGVYQHGKDGEPQTLEGQVVRFADNIAYIAQDIDDLCETRVISIEDYTYHSEEGELISAKGVDMSWTDINTGAEICLNNAFKQSRGLRTAVLIERFIKYNESLLRSGSLDYRPSHILEKSIPILKIDAGMGHVIDAIWEIIKPQYAHKLINTSSHIQECKMNELWEILSDPQFCEANVCYSGFMDRMRDSRFIARSDDWKRAYFITHLSWSEVDLIIDSFHKRDYTFDIDI
jgi:hypothetical protein